ncbi:uncharacterized protein AMSG_01048 [Thecamonas trahens ATCC 50062]|uniref:Uncharacterized protein n=1 Tax=Thecamonas trahens ATCC 50062 TaxID=461836 RepID=A0A0L0DJ43_THETB|nr:hypothetical protein AMSG_01048 [Thecamonas trahens ATCC 50062]KNC52220.1 hypothetical protein AMSG_01048 [Thecamonas trahens ATCC 50062]|eukprot:XP_013762223.1 hypothetical protein AMSG_01048 [Thecamonas trahens ATCC 50062]
MGISGLLPALHGATTAIHVSELTGSVVGVDGASWLFRGGYICAHELCTGRPTRRFADYVLDAAQTLVDAGLTPVVVFDGAVVPVKAELEAVRCASRASQVAEGLAQLAGGNKCGYRKLMAGFPVSCEMAAAAKQVLDAAGIACMFAPYEADAQLAALFHAGVISAVVTDDSDMLAYGVDRVLVKFNKDSGRAHMIRLAHLARSTSLDLVGFDGDMFLHMCILAGCDYGPSLRGTGLKRAHALVKHAPTLATLLNVLAATDTVPRSYLTAFLAARLTFRHQTVFDPASHEARPLFPLDLASIPPLPHDAPPLPADLHAALSPAPSPPGTCIQPR